MFVCFDYEELGLYGSRAFVDKYLIPIEIIENQSHFIGAYITDMLLNFNDNENTQTLPADIKLKVPKINKISESNRHRGNFIALWNRKNIDSELANKLSEVWRKSKDGDRYKLFNMNPRLPVTVKHNTKTSDLGTFVRSDHANFWYPKYRNFDSTLNAVLLTDLGPWRAEFNVCYHKSCDDEKQLTKLNLEFFSHTTKMLYKMLTENPPTLTDNNSLLNRNHAINYSIRKSSSRRIPRFRTLIFIDNSHLTLN